MNPLKKLFSGKKRNPEAINGICKTINPLIDRVCDEVMQEHKDVLIKEEPSFVVYAVWGAGNQGGLTETQSAINKKVMPVINSVITELMITNLDKDQQYAIEYLIRGLIITKLLFMTEMLKNRIFMNSVGSYQELIRKLAALEPQGNA
jgi:hypothetical protein